MKFPIDVVFLSRKKKVLKIRPEHGAPAGSRSASARIRCWNCRRELWKNRNGRAGDQLEFEKYRARTDKLTAELAVLFENAPVHHHVQSGRARALAPPPRGSRLPASTRSSRRSRSRIRQSPARTPDRRKTSTMSIFSGTSSSRAIALLTQHFGLLRIHRNDPVSGALHVCGDAVARAHRDCSTAPPRRSCAAISRISGMFDIVLHPSLAACGTARSPWASARDNVPGGRSSSRNPIFTRRSFSTSRPKCLNMMRIWFCRPSAMLHFIPGIRAGLDLS